MILAAGVIYIINIYIFTYMYTSMPIAGISEMERKRRKESNIFTTKINFIAWLLEVLNNT